jgi:hypothetical protein
MTFFWALILLVLPTQESEALSKARKLFFEFEQPGCVSEKLFEMLQQTAEKSDVLLAYQGAAEASSADCATFPFAKLKRFNQGKGKLEQAVKNDPFNAEIRFLRFSIQSKAPGFLNYTDAVDQDFDLIISSLADKNDQWQEETFKNNVIKFLLAYPGTTDQQADVLRKMLNDK